MKRYYLWILAPLFLAFIGGIAAFLATRKRDREFAFICLGLGIFSSIVYIAYDILSTPSETIEIPPIQYPIVPKIPEIPAGGGQGTAGAVG
jgi:hypothetical protein